MSKSQLLLELLAKSAEWKIVDGYLMRRPIQFVPPAKDVGRLAIRASWLSSWKALASSSEDLRCEFKEPSS